MRMPNYKFHLFINPLHLKVLMVVHSAAKRGVKVTEVSRAVNATFSHISKIILDLQQRGLIDAEKNGRSKYCRLTKRGEQVLAHLIAVEVAVYGRYKFI